MTRIENIFFTHQSWDNIGGLMGKKETTKICHKDYCEDR